MNLTDVADNTVAMLCEEYGAEPQNIDEPPRHIITSPYVDFTPKQNWVNYVVGRLEGVESTGDIQHWFTKEDDPSVAVYKAVVAAVEGWNNHDEYGEKATELEDWAAIQYRSFVDCVVGRYIKGGIGEMYVASMVNGRILDEQDGDEKAGIDLRTTEATYQIKTVGKWDTADFDKQNADVLVEVKIDPSGEQPPQMREV